tara:strand:- start:234 stop:473 length:240 start_codon:yes stop_codon:yes gene_type:complete
MNQRANEIKLNDEQFEQLQTLYIQTVVDSMKVEELEQYVTNDMEDYCNSLTEKELISEIEYKLSDVELNEFVTEIQRGN